MASGTTSPKIAAVLRLPTGWIDSITDRFFLLASHPYLGRARDDDFGAGSRSFVVGEYVVIYCIEDEVGLILRAPHGARDIAALFDQDVTMPRDPCHVARHANP